MSFVKQIEKRRTRRDHNQPWRIVAVVDPETITELKSSLTSGNCRSRKAAAITAFVMNVDRDARLNNGRVTLFLTSEWR